MTYLLVDDEPLALKNLELELQALVPDAQLCSFSHPDQAISWLSQNTADVALLDIHMRQMDGITLAKIVKNRCPYCAILFVTGYSQYAVDAFQLHADGYLMKPINSQTLQREIAYITKQNPPVPRVRVQCFGNFEVFLDGKIMSFPRQKSKELLAYLVDRRGAGASMAEIAAILWEDGIYDKSRNRQIHVFLHDLSTAFATANVPPILTRQRNTVAVDCEHFQCDYYDYLAGDEKAISAYCGEYMTQYSWAEITNGSLSSLP